MMSTTILTAAKAVFCGGLALWTSLAVVNNIQDWRNSLAVVAGTMRMQALVDDPAFESPLLARRVTRPVLHRIAFGAIVLAQLTTAILLWIGTACLITVLAGQISTDTALVYATLGCAAFSTLWLICFLAPGLWFGYWIKADVLQLTHMTLFVVGVVSTAFMQIAVS